MDDLEYTAQFGRVISQGENSHPQVGEISRQSAKLKLDVNEFDQEIQRIRSNPDVVGPTRQAFLTDIAKNFLGEILTRKHASVEEMKKELEELEGLLKADVVSKNESSAQLEAEARDAFRKLEGGENDLVFLDAIEDGDTLLFMAIKNNPAGRFEKLVSHDAMKTAEEIIARKANPERHRILREFGEKLATYESQLANAEAHAREAGGLADEIVGIAAGAELTSVSI
jgi:hypothetical protein